MSLSKRAHKTVFSGRNAQPGDPEGTRLVIKVNPEDMKFDNSEESTLTRPEPTYPVRNCITRADLHRAQVAMSAHIKPPHEQIIFMPVERPDCRERGFPCAADGLSTKQRLVINILRMSKGAYVAVGGTRGTYKIYRGDCKHYVRPCHMRKITVDTLVRRNELVETEEGKFTLRA